MKNPSDLQGENERQRKKKPGQEQVRRSLHKGDVTRNDSQRRFLAQHIVAMLEKCCNYSKQCCNNVATPCCAKNRRCESSRVLNRVTRTFLEVSRCSLANQRQRNVQKSVLHVQSSFFWLLNLLLFFHRSLCLCRLRWCYTGRFATTIFNTTHPCNVGTML